MAKKKLKNKERKVVKSIRTEPETFAKIQKEFGKFSTGVDFILKNWLEIK